MSKPVNGFLAGDGSFFEDEPECQRYEAMKELETLCDTHSINFENFMATLNAWHNPIERYYDADDKSKTHQVGKPVKFEPKDGYYEPGDDIPGDDEPFLPAKGDHPDFASGDKDAPGFLEQQIRRHK